MDCVDRERLLDSKGELESVRTDETIASVPRLILGNKIGRPEAIGEEGSNERCLVYVIREQERAVCR